MKHIAAALLCCAAFSVRAAETLDHVRAANRLTCGVISELNDETKDDTHGNLAALGTDFCRAIAAAVLGDKAPIQVMIYPQAALAYQALHRGDIAIMVGDTPSDGLARRYDIEYTTPIFFDYQGLLVHKDRGIASLKDLAGKPVCFIGTTDAEMRLHRAAEAQGIRVGLFPFEEVGEQEAALVGGRCAAETFDVSKLAADRTQFHGMIADFVILPDRLDIDPFAPVVRDDDPQWARIVNAVFFALVQAEQLGVTQANAASGRTGSDALVQSLLGARRGTNWGVFLADDWAYRAIEAVGSYGEMLRRRTGDGSPLRLPRGLNALAEQGGLIWAPPIR